MRTPVLAAIAVGIALGLASSLAEAQVRSTPVTVTNTTANPVPVTGATPVFQYMGRSTDFTLPNIGMVGLGELCHAAHPGSRMCTSRELLETPNPPVTDGNQWVHPSIVGILPDGRVLDYSGHAGTIEGLTCGAQGFNLGPWTQATGAGAMVLVPSTKQLVLGGCAAIRAVACCAPRALPSAP